MTLRTLNVSGVSQSSGQHMSHLEARPAPDRRGLRQTAAPQWYRYSGQCNMSGDTLGAQLSM
jgi:hypothetical protein